MRQWLLESALLHLSIGNLALLLCNYVFHPFFCTGSISLCLLYIKEWQFHAMGRNTMLLFPLKNPSFQFSKFNSSQTLLKTYYLGKIVINDCFDFFSGDTENMVSPNNILYMVYSLTCVFWQNANCLFRQEMQNFH